MIYFLLFVVASVAAIYWATRANKPSPPPETLADWTTRTPAWSPQNAGLFKQEESFDWIGSENGNSTCVWNFIDATVFQQDGGWKYVVNVEGGQKDDAVFSKRYRSHDQAIIEAEKYMESLADKVASRRP